MKDRGHVRGRPGLRHHPGDPGQGQRRQSAEAPKRFGRGLYRGRARIEQAVGKLKRFKRIALRCEKTKTNFASFGALAIGFILLKFLHTT